MRKHPILKNSLLSLASLVAIGLTTAFFYVFINLKTVPRVNTQALTTYPETKLVDIHNNVIWQDPSKTIETIKYDQIPNLYKKALIATEDENYWHENGYSPKGIANSLLSIALSKLGHGDARGGSTIDQQLIKNVYFDGGIGINTATRKIQELYLAQQLNHNFNKKQILTFYVNNLQYAENAQGVASVMKIYFGKNPGDYQKNTIKNIAQLAYLAGLGQAPSSYNLYTNPKLANKRKNIVLKIMYDKNIITKKQYQSARHYDLTRSLKKRYWLTKQRIKQNSEYKFYSDEVLNELSELGYNTNRLSMTVHTYLDPAKFKQVETIVRSDQYYQDGSTKKLQGAASVVDHNGRIVAIIGSRTDSSLNRALMRNRSSGSSLKPFTAYGPLFQYFGNRYATNSVISAAAYRYPGTNTYMYNYGKENPGNVTLQRALRMSYNTPVGRIDDNILGSNRMKAFLSKVGLDVKDSYSSVDGIGLNVSTLDAAGAYNALNNGGIYTKPRGISKIEFTDGSVKRIKPEKVKAMNASTAYVLLQMLRGVITNNGTAPDANIKNYNGYAGKTGTVAFAGNHTNQIYGDGGSDAWFNSVTNNGYSISVWEGYDVPNESPAVSDKFEGSAKLGKALQLALNGNKNIDNWIMPTGVEHLSGTGLNAQYRVTDSADLDSNLNSLWANPLDSYSVLVKLQKVRASVNPGNWQKHLKNSDVYKYYQNHSDTDFSILNADAYNLAKKESENNAN